MLERILVFNVNWVGDVVFSTPIFKALKKNYPAAYVACAAVPRVREVLECVYGIDEIIVYDEKGRHRSLAGKLKFAAELRHKKFDAAFLVHRSWTRALLVFLAGILVRAGYDDKRRGRLLTHRVVSPQIGGTSNSADIPVHRSDHYLRVIESYGAKVDDRRCELKPDALSVAEVRRMLAANGVKEGDFLAVIHVGANWDLKRWPADNFSGLIRRLVSDGNTKVVIPGAGHEAVIAREVADRSQAHPILLTRQTTLKQLGALMSLADLVISSDSGPMHIANCTGTDVIAIFGPTRPEITGPRGKGKFVVLQKDVICNREACYNLACPDNRCMQAVTVDDVMAAVQSLKCDTRL